MNFIKFLLLACIVGAIAIILGSMIHDAIGGVAGNAAGAFLR